MKEKESRQENSTENRKKIIIASLIILVILVALLLIIFNRKIKYDITFETNGGSLVETCSVDEDGLIIKPEDPVREGYVFLGWYYNGELFDFSTPVTSDMVLEARWAKIGEVSGVSLNNTELTLKIGETAKLVATITPEDATNKNVTWESSDPSVVSVDAEGNIKALKEGTATITVTTEEGKFTATAKITVKKAETVTNEVTNNKGNSNNGTTNNGNTGSGNNNGGTTDSGNTENSGTTTPTETVVNVTGVSLDKTSLTLTEGDSSKLTATINPSNANNKNVTWASSNTGVVTVDNNGNVTAVKPGTATITVTTADGGFTATCQVTVNEKPARYSVTLTAIEQPGIPVSQYSVTVKKNGVSFSDWKVVEFNNTVAKPGNPTISSIKYDGITSATITLSDGSTVTATVNK